VETLVLRGTATGTYAVPREWTSLAQESPVPEIDGERPILDAKCLVVLVGLVNQLDRRPQGAGKNNEVSELT
jgi:hypothetical protein